MDLLVPKQVASRLGCSTVAVYSLLNQGAFPGAFRIKKAWRIPVESFGQFVRQRQQAAIEAAREDEGRSLAAIDQAAFRD